MNDEAALARQFETHRPRLRALAYRMLGSVSDAHDAVQEAWLRLRRSNEGPENLGAWLTTTVSRLCLDTLRSRRQRAEEGMTAAAELPAVGAGSDPEQDAALADSVGLALLLMLGRLDPAERVSFVLHDMFDLPFEDIARIVGRSVEASRQLASRARRRVRGGDVGEVDRERQRAVAQAFLTASHEGDLQGLLAVLAPDAVFSSDEAGVQKGSVPELQGAEAVARLFKGRAQAARVALVEGAVVLVVAPQDRLVVLLRLSFADGQIVAIDAVADAAALSEVGYQVL